MTEKVKFPAKFSASIIERLDELVPPGSYLDPFAGVGGVHQLERPDRHFIGVEIEPEWVACHLNTMQGNALYLSGPAMLRKFKNFGVTLPFDGCVFSPTYGNRFADHHHAKDTSERRSYTHDLRTMTGDFERELHPDNTGTQHFGAQYLDMHLRAYKECYRVTKPDGLMFLNVSDFIRDREVVRAVVAHITLLQRAGWEITGRVRVPTPRMRHGQNHDARVEDERIILARRVP